MKRRFVACCAALALGAAATSGAISIAHAGDPPDEEPTVTGQELPNFDALWDYQHPDSTEARFREIADREGAAAPVEYRLQLDTQIARTLGLQRRFDEAHAHLDGVESALAEHGDPGHLTNELKIVRTRYLLERGRVHNSSGSPDAARPLFREAWELGRGIRADFYAVDAAHMMAIIEAAESATSWFEKGCAVAEASADPRARGWLGALYNNLAWTYHDAGDYEKALEVFRKAQAWREEKGDTRTIQIARYSVARCLRSLERYDEAMAIQQALAKELEAEGSQDGYVHEELGELYLAIGQPETAAPCFARAHALLSADPWLQANESERLARMKRLGRGAGR